VLVDAALSHASVQYVEPFLALAAADDFADPNTFIAATVRPSSFTRM
jgi:hypothetical protein